jgi:hypothetical protein
MNIVAAIACLWLPLSAIGLVMGVAVFQAAVPPYPFVPTAATVIACGSVVWAAASIKTGIGRDINELRKAMENMVTRDAMELRLSQERTVSDRCYVTQQDCEHNHVKLNGRLDNIVNGKSKGTANGG